MKRFKVVGWYVDDPHDENSNPRSLTVKVDANTRSEAFSLGEHALYTIAARPSNLLNWYVKEETND